MAYTHTTGITYTTNAGRLASTTVVKTADTELGIQDTIGANGGVTHFIIGVDVSELESFCLFSDQDVTVYENANNNSVLQIDLAANVMYTWNSSSTAANPLSVDVTGLYVHNDGTAVANIKFQFLLNQPSGS